MKNLAKALCDFQAEVGSIPKTSTNPFFKSKYADLDTIITHIKPFLTKNHLAFSQLPDGKGLKTILMHESGETIEATMELVIKEQTPQSQGSSLTYARRYALSAILGLSTDEDDDGNGATPKTAPQVNSTPTKAPVEAKPTPPKVVADKVKTQKKIIQTMCDAKALNPLVDAADYKAYVLANTNLELIDSNLSEIITRLEALK